MLATIAVQTGDWNSPSTWDNGVPDATERAIIPSGRTVTLNGTNHSAREIVVQGILDVAESGSDKTLTANWIHVNSGGVFQIGTESNRFDAVDFTVTLTGDDPTQTFNIEGAGQVTDNDSFLMVGGGGRLQFFGKEKLSFTKLATTANVNSNQIIVENVIERNFDGTTSAASDGSLDWEVGDRIVIASSSDDYNDEEVRNITAITDLGNGTSRVTLNASLNRRHYGEIETYGNGTRTWDIDMRAEVALLNRNVKIQGLASHDTDNFFGDRTRYNNGTGDGFGGHTMIMGSAGQITVDSVQFDGMGQTSRLGRYPIHWHIAGDRSGDVLRGASITNSNNRGLTIHGTHNVLIQDVVLHDIQGHGFFMEDGVETGNQYISNIAFGIHKVGRSEAVGDFAPDVNDPFIVDTHDHVGQNANRFLSSAAYWVTNPDNNWVGNISAGSEGTGFWFILPNRAIGVSASDPQYNNVRPERTNLRQFDYNSSHASPAGLNFDRGSDLEGPVGGNLKAFFDGDNWLPPDEPQINFYTAYQHRVGVYHRGFDANFHEMRFADNFTSTFVTFTQRITDSLYVGHSRGNSNLSDRVTGHTLYDGANTLDGVHFAGFADNDAHTFRAHSAARRNTHHVMSNTSFEDDGSAFNVSIATQGGGSNHNSATNQFTPSAIYDADGTLTGHVGGVAGSTVVSNHPFFYDANDFQPAGWNAWVSDDLYSFLRFYANNSSADIRFTSPDGDSSTGSNNNSKTVVKLDAGDYTIDFPGGVNSVRSGFEILFQVDVGPDNGSTMVRFRDIRESLTLDNIPRVRNLATLRNSNRRAFAVDGDDLWVKFFSSSNRVDFVPGTNAPNTNESPNAVGDTATTTTGNSVTIDVLDNDSDPDNDPLTVTVVPGDGSVVVADYVDDFQRGTPANGWQYLYNASGAFGSSNYTAMVASGTGYRPSGQTYPIIASSYAHAGDGTAEDSNGLQRYAIAAFTVPESGFYFIANSAVSMNANRFPVDGVNISAHITGGDVTTLGVFGQGESGNFDGPIGFATAGQVIYVGVGANTHKGDDNTTLDFSIVRATGPTNGEVTVNPDKTINFSPTPGFAGATSFTYRIDDGQGGFDTATVNVTVQPPAVIPSIVSVVRDGGDQSRPDLWSTLQIEFNTDVRIFSSSLQLFHDTDGGSPVSLAGAQFDYDSTNFVATWNFENMATPMQEAYYTYHLSSPAVTSINGQTQLDGDGNGTAGGDLTRQEYVAIPGDADLDGSVDVLGDGFILVSNLGTNGGAMWSQGDFNNDGNVDVLGDGFALVRNLGKSVTPPSAAPAQFAVSSPFPTSDPSEEIQRRVVAAKTDKPPSLRLTETLILPEPTFQVDTSTNGLPEAQIAQFTATKDKPRSTPVQIQPTVVPELSGNQARDNVFSDPNMSYPVGDDVSSSSLELASVLAGDSTVL